jgi:hypothetical protein
MAIPTGSCIVQVPRGSRGMTRSRPGRQNAPGPLLMPDELPARSDRSRIALRRAITAFRKG